MNENAADYDDQEIKIVVTCSDHIITSNNKKGSRVSFYLKYGISKKKKICHIEFDLINARKECITSTDCATQIIIENQIQKLKQKFQCYDIETFYDDKSVSSQYKTKYIKGSYVKKERREKTEDEKMIKKEKRREYARQYMRERRNSEK